MKRLVVGMMLFAVGPGAYSRTMANGVDNSWFESVAAADSSEHLAFLPIVDRKSGIRAVFGTDPALTSSDAAGIGDQIAQTAWLQQDEPLLTDEPQCDVVDECCCEPCERACPTVYAQVEALFLWREPRLDNQPLVVDAVTGETLLSTSDLDDGLGSGGRVTAGVRICGGRALEFTYFGLCPDDASARFVSTDPNAFLIFPGNFFGNVFVGMGQLDVDYSSWLNSFEANLPCCCGCCEPCCDECGCPQTCCQTYEYFGGFRYMRVGERLDMTAQRTVAGLIEEGTYNIRTTNNLYGLQLGGRMRRTQGKYGWEAMAKAGIFGNDARQTQSVTDFPDFPIRPTVSTGGGRIAFVGETNLTALYRITPVWNLRAGYSILWLRGLALAPDQLDFDFAASPGGNQLNDEGSMFLHGFNTGIEARW